MDLIPLKNAVLDRDTAIHIEIACTPDGTVDIVRLFPMEVGKPIELYMEAEAAIELAAHLGLHSTPPN